MPKIICGVWQYWYLTIPNVCYIMITTNQTGANEMNDNYGTLTTKKNTSPVIPGDFVSHANIMIRIVATPVTSGSEKQQSYATSLKLQALESVDKVTDNLIKRGANAERTIDFRNRLMVAIDEDNDARHLIDNLQMGAVNDINTLVKVYNVKP